MTTVSPLPEVNQLTGPHWYCGPDIKAFGSKLENLKHSLLPYLFTPFLMRPVYGMLSSGQYRLNENITFE